jgi:hypothetical protein
MIESEKKKKRDGERERENRIVRSDWESGREGSRMRR